MTQEQVNDPNFDPGGRVDRVDPRDYQWEEIGSSLLPFEWSEAGYDVEQAVSNKIGIPFKLPVKDQGEAGSCGGQAWSYYGQVLEAVASKTSEERSAKFIYAQTYIPPAGSAGRPNCQLVIKQGWGLESLTPSYRNGYPPDEGFMQQASDITDEARANAKFSRAMSYANTRLDIDSMAQALAYNYGLIIGIAGTNNGTWLSEFPAPPQNTNDVWRHWLYVGRAKIINGKKALGVLNSWGEIAGNKGWQWITEDYFRVPGAVWSGWTLIFDSNSLPPEPFHFVFNHNMEFGEKSDDVRTLQEVLKMLGYMPTSIPSTGYYGNITAAAVYKFQVAHNIIPPDRNHVGPRTRAALNKLLSN